MNALKRLNPDDIHVFDIETTGIVSDYADLDIRGRLLFTSFCEKELDEDPFTDNLTLLGRLWKVKAGLMPCFQKIVCIAVSGPKDSYVLSNNDEYTLLRQFADLCAEAKPKFWAGHNIKGFDLPVISRRCLVNGLPIPHKMDIMGVKPWDLGFIIDTLELFKIGVFGNQKGTTLDSACYAFGVPSPKQNIDGSMVHTEWYKGKHKEIENYCLGDTKYNRELLLKMIHNSKT